MARRLTASVGLLGAALLPGVAQGKTAPVRLSQARRPARSAAVVRRSPVPTAAPGCAGGGGSGALRWAGPSWWPQAPVVGWLGGARPGWCQGADRWLGSRHRHQGGVRSRPGHVAPCPAPGEGRRLLRSVGAFCGVRRWQGSAAVRVVPQQGQASAGRHPTARGAPAGVAAVGHREARAPASVASHPTRVCRRRPTASARASLRLLGAPETWRSAPEERRNMIRDRKSVV